MYKNLVSAEDPFFTDDVKHEEDSDARKFFVKKKANHSGCSRD